MARKSEAQQIQELLSENGIDCLYHFTSVENLSCILESGGLVSKKILDEVSVLPDVIIGGNGLSRNLDRTNSNWDKVSLYFTPYTPMAYNRKCEMHLCYLLINPRVATGNGVVFTDTNATANGHTRAYGMAGLRKVNFDVFKRPAMPSDIGGWKRPVQAEVLVPDYVRVDDIMKIVFPTEASREYGKYLCGRKLRASLTDVDPTLFAADRYSKEILFPHVTTLRLTNCEVDTNNYASISVGLKTFSRSQCDMITAVVQITSRRNSIRGEYYWLDSKECVIEEGEVPFGTESDHWIHWPSISINAISNGVNYFQYYLNDILWSTIRFKVTS